jgi:hypothetical protein
MSRLSIVLFHIVLTATVTVWATQGRSLNQSPFEAVQLQEVPAVLHLAPNTESSVESTLKKPSLFIESEEVYAENQEVRPAASI